MTVTGDSPLLGTPIEAALKRKTGVPKSAEERKVFSVTELTRLIRFTLEEKFSSVWVEGEISNFIHHGSGHMYFSLKDSEASLQAVMFRRDNQRLRFKPEDGLKVLARGRVSVYPQRGQYQLLVDYLEPKGLGDLQLAFEQLKRKLEKEGFFDLARKKPIPFLPRRIGVITSLTGAVIRDMLHVLDRRFPSFHFIIYPVQVQGDRAKHEIAKALDDMNEYRQVDVLVLARGGGSLEDLWPFNEEMVARAIFRSRIPVISAVGHEVDYTIADFVADLRAPTPSAAAEILFPRREDLKAQIEDQRRRLNESIQRQLEFGQQELDEAGRYLQTAMTNRLGLERERWNALAGRLEALSPMACLDRGYSITFDEKSSRIIKSVRHLEAGQRVATRLADGTFVSIVSLKEKKEET